MANFQLRYFLKSFVGLIFLTQRQIPSQKLHWRPSGVFTVNYKRIKISNLFFVVNMSQQLRTGLIFIVVLKLKKDRWLERKFVIILKEFVSQDQTEATTRCDLSQKTTRVTTRDNTRQHEYNTTQHEYNTRQHEYNTTQHEYKGSSGSKNKALDRTFCY